MLDKPEVLAEVTKRPRLYYLWSSTHIHILALLFRWSDVGASDQVPFETIIGLKFRPVGGIKNWQDPSKIKSSDLFLATGFAFMLDIN